MPKHHWYVDDEDEDDGDEGEGGDRRTMDIRRMSARSGQQRA